MKDRPVILVLAGVNGAGKSSVLGSILSDKKIDFYNPDQFAREYLKLDKTYSIEEANSAAWEYGRKALESAIQEKRVFAFETTLGGNTISEMLLNATSTHDVRMYYCGLDSVQKHIERVKQRVAAGGHDIPEDKIRERWGNSILNLIKLMPYLSALKVFDNSVEVARNKEIPNPVKVLEIIDGVVNYPDFADVTALRQVKEWAKPLIIGAEDMTEKINNPKI
jgi:predicted ABC-type ATPase